MFEFVFVCLKLDSRIIDFSRKRNHSATTARDSDRRVTQCLYWVTPSVTWVASCRRLLPHGSVCAVGQWGIEETTEHSTDWTAAGRSGEWPRRSLFTRAWAPRGCSQQSFRDVQIPKIWVCIHPHLRSASVNYTSWMTYPQDVCICTILFIYSFYSLFICTICTTLWIGSSSQANSLRTPTYLELRNVVKQKNTL